MKRSVIDSGPGVTGQWRGRRILLLLALVTLLPTIAAALLSWSGWHPHGRNLSSGELLDPVRPLPELTLHSTDGDVRSLATLRGKWLLLVVLDRPCSEACRSLLYAMQQIRLAQGDHMRRVERVLIASQREKGELTRLANDFGGTQVWTGDGRAMTALGKTMGNAGQNIAERFFIVDPAGNLVMRYPPAANASGVSKDLTRLLRMSRLD